MQSEEATSTDDAELSTLISSASLMLVGSLFGAFSKLFEKVFLARVLPEPAFDAFTKGFSMLMLGSTIALVGFDQAIPRFMSRFDDDRDIRGVWVSGITIAGAVGVAMAAVLVLAAGPLRRVVFGADTPLLLPVSFAVAIPLLVGLRVAVGAIRGHENTIYRTLSYDLLYNGLRVVVLLVLLFGVGLGVLATGYAYIVGAAVAFVVAHLLLNRLLPLRGSFRTHTRGRC